MNPVFWLLVVVIAVVLWFLLAFVFYPIGKFLWKDKTDVTEEAISAVAQYLLMNHKEFRFEVEDKMMVLKVVKAE